MVRDCRRNDGEVKGCDAERTVSRVGKMRSQCKAEVLTVTSGPQLLNPIELIWAQVKMHVRKENSNDRQTLQRVEELTKQAIESISAERW